MEGSKKYLIVIIGPTAIGKTDLAINIARDFATEIISADSRQFYAEMSIGTAKPTTEELLLAKHHFIGSKSITQPYSAGDFENDAISCVTSIFMKNDTAVMVGGSGLFVKAVTDGFDQFPKIKPALREELNQKFEELGIEYLQKKLFSLDPDYYNQVDLNNPQRLIRALEVSIETRQPYSSFRMSTEKRERAFKTIKIGLDMNRPALYDRINRRVDRMIEEGLVEEVRSLLPFKNLNALNTVGYSEIFEYFNGKYSLDDAVAAIKQNTRRFAKRQLTWFRKDSEISWFHPEEYSNIVSYINNSIRPER